MAIVRGENGPLRNRLLLRRAMFFDVFFAPFDKSLLPDIKTGAGVRIDSFGPGKNAIGIGGISPGEIHLGEAAKKLDQARLECRFGRFVVSLQTNVFANSVA